MKLSIITTAYNMQDYIEETLESVLSQKGNFFLEYFVIDAASSDNTPEIINKYKKRVDEGFYSGRNNGITMSVIREPDNGMYEGITKGLIRATGDVVAYINADDFYMPNAFSCVCEIFSKFKNVNWLTGRQNAYNEKGHNFGNYLYTYSRHLILAGLYGAELYFLQQESTFWRRKLLDDLDYDKLSSFKYAGDYYLWHTFAEKHELYTVDSVLSGFRCLKSQKSSVNEDKYFTEFLDIANVKEINLNDVLKSVKNTVEFSNKIIYDRNSHEWLLHSDEYDFSAQIKKIIKNKKKSASKIRIFLKSLLQKNKN